MRPTHEHYFLSLLPGLAARGTCARRQVACVLVDEHNRILSTGYNGVPSGMVHCEDPLADTDVTHYMSQVCEGRKDPPGQSDRCHAVHAEVNAVLNCRDLREVHTAYVSCEPCFTCAKMLCNIPSLKRVICAQEYADERGKTLLAAAGINLTIDIGYKA